MASQWRKISQEEAFVGRTHQVEDELGSRVVAARMVREIMRLCFIQEKKYIPYTKWFGKGFQQLESAAHLTPVLLDVISVTDFESRESKLSEAYEYVATRHNNLNITEQLEAEVSDFWDRPFKVIHGERFEKAIKDEIKSEILKNLTIKFGSVDQFVDDTDFLSNHEVTSKSSELYI